MTKPRPSKVRYSHFRKAVLQYRPSDLLPALAKLSPDISAPDADKNDWHQLSPFGIAAMARESVLYGNDKLKARVVGEAEIFKLHATFTSSYDGPQVDKKIKDTLFGITTRFAYEQFRYQESDYEELTRCVSIFRYALSATPNTPITSDLVDSLLGRRLEEAISAGIALHCVMAGTGGIWKDEFTNIFALQEMYQVVSPDAIIALKDELSLDLSSMKKHYRNVVCDNPTPDHLERWGYNPLFAYPLIKLSNGDVVAPLSRLILMRISITSLSYAGSKYMDNFLGHFGTVIQTYVGQQLNLIHGAKVLPEIMWGKTENKGKSIDWFLVLPNCVLFIEVKSANFSVNVRAGNLKNLEDVILRFNEARDQINKTYEKFEQNHAALYEIPRDRPIFGIIVTSANLHMANASYFTDSLLPTKVPVLTWSLRDLEHFVPNSAANLGNAIEAVMNDAEKRTWPAHTSIGIFLENKMNAIAEKAASQIPILFWIEKFAKDLKRIAGEHENSD